MFSIKDLAPKQFNSQQLIIKISSVNVNVICIYDRWKVYHTPYLSIIQISHSNIMC